MFINGDGNWVNILNDAVVTYNNNIHSTINMTPVDASNNPEKVKYTFSFKNIKSELNFGDYVRNVDKRNIFSKGYTSNWNRELFKVNEVLKTHPPTYKLEDINGELIEGKYYEQELLKSEFDFETNNKALESLNIFLKINNDKKPIQSSETSYRKYRNGNNLTLSKARGLFLEDNDNIDMKDTYKITNVHPPIDEKDVVNKEYCDNNSLSSSNKIDILSRNITELRKGDFDKVTTKTLQLNETQVNEELISEFIESTNEVRNIVKFCNKVAADTISKYNQLKQEFDNNKFNQNITNIHLDEMFTNGLREMKEYNKSLRGVIVNNIIAILLQSKLLDNKEKDRLEMHYSFNQEDIMKEIERIFNFY